MKTKGAICSTCANLWCVVRVLNKQKTGVMGCASVLSVFFSLCPLW
jgi:hypothetical protein